MLEIIKNLEHFGLSTNAARAYCSLLKSNPATGYEISSQANIPRSAVYNVLNKLESMGMISGMGDKPKRYIPLSPSSLIEHLENSHQDSIEELKHGLEHMKLDEEAFDFWHIHGYKNLILKLKEAIKAALDRLDGKEEFICQKCGELIWTLGDVVKAYDVKAKSWKIFHDCGLCYECWKIQKDPDASTEKFQRSMDEFRDAANDDTEEDTR